MTRDLQKMLDLGIFPEGHLDEQKTCFMLNDVVYRQYLEAENNYTNACLTLLQAEIQLERLYNEISY